MLAGEVRKGDRIWQQAVEVNVWGEIKKVVYFKAGIVIVDDVLILDQYRYDSETSALLKITRAHMNQVLPPTPAEITAYFLMQRRLTCSCRWSASTMRSEALKDGSIPPSPASDLRKPRDATRRPIAPTAYAKINATENTSAITETLGEKAEAGLCEYYRCSVCPLMRTSDYRGGTSAKKNAALGSSRDWYNVNEKMLQCECNKSMYLTMCIPDTPTCTDLDEYVCESAHLNRKTLLQCSRQYLSFLPWSLLLP